MKSVWILNHYASGPDDSGGTRHFHLAKYLQPRGWEATLIAASTNHATDKQRLSVKEPVRFDVLQGVPFLWLRAPSYKGNHGGRVLNMLAYTLRALWPGTTKKLKHPDVIIGSSVHPFAAVAGALLARRHNAPFIFEVRDLWPQTLVDMGRLKNDALLTWVLRKVELWLYRRASRIVVLLPEAWQYIVPLGVPKERVVWVPNGVDLSLFPRSLLKSEEKGTFTLMYFGAHGQANGLDNVLQAMQLVQKSPHGAHVRLRLIGNGPLKPKLEARSIELGLTNTVFEMPVPKKQIPVLAAQADAFVIAVLDLPSLYRFGISMNKLFDYLAVGRPIVIAFNEIYNPIAKAQAGLTVPAEHPQSLAEAIIQIANTPLIERQRMGAAGREYVEKNHGFDYLAAKLAAVLDNVCDEHAAKR